MECICAYFSELVFPLLHILSHFLSVSFPADSRVTVTEDDSRMIFIRCKHQSVFYTK